MAALRGFDLLRPLDLELLATLSDHPRTDYAHFQRNDFLKAGESAGLIHLIAQGCVKLELPVTQTGRAGHLLAFLGSGDVLGEFDYYRLPDLAIARAMCDTRTWAFDYGHFVQILSRSRQLEHQLGKGVAQKAFFNLSVRARSGRDESAELYWLLRGIVERSLPSGQAAGLHVDVPFKWDQQDVKSFLGCSSHIAKKAIRVLLFAKLIAGTRGEESDAWQIDCAISPDKVPESIAAGELLEKEDRQK